MRRSPAFWLMIGVLLVAAALRLPTLESAPPGLHYDEAANAILSADIGLRGARPLFITSYTGKDVLFFYAAGGTMRLIGDSVFALRLTAAFAGLLTVAATYWLSLELFATTRQRARAIGVLAAILLATSFAHLLFSRLGFRAVTQPLLQALTVAALLRGARTGKRRWLVLGGVWLGATAYTYLAARLFPLLLGMALLPLLWTRSRRRWGDVALYLSTGLLVLLPLLVYFAQNPEAFWVRIDQVSAESGSSFTLLVESTITTLGMFFVRGDPYWRFNLPDQPLFGLLTGALAVAGWVWLLTRWRAWHQPQQRFAIVLLCAAPLVMILPSALAVGEIVPSNLRAIGVWPFLAFLPALAVVAAIGRLPQRRQLRTLAVIAPALLVVGGAVVAQRYFAEWAQRSDVYYENDSDLLAVSAFVDQLPPDQTPYVAALHYRHPTVAFTAQRYDAIQWLPESEALVQPANGPATVVYPHSSPAPAWTEPLLASAERTNGPAGPDGVPQFVAYTLPSVERLTLPTDDFMKTDVNFDNVLRLDGVTAGPGTSGETLPVTLLWQVTGQPGRPLLPFVHVEDATGTRWGQAEAFAYPSEQWQVGDTIVQHVDVPLQPGMPTDGYTVHIGVFDPDSAEQIPRLDAAGRFAGTTWRVEQTPIAAAAAQPGNEPSLVLSSIVADGLTLQGAERGGPEAATGDPFWLALWWDAAAQPPDDLAMQLLLVGEGGAEQVWLETQPAQGRFPFAAWDAPLFVRDIVAPRVPADLPSGTYTIVLSLTQGDRASQDIDLGPLAVTQTDRLFTPPPSETASDASFGDQIRLVGYTAREDGGGTTTLELVWQALEPLAADYTRFVHVLDPDGVCCAWQQDSAPQGGAYPTTRWLPGEVVVETLVIELPDGVEAGAYPVEVGFYLPQNGLRLPVSAEGVPDRDFYYLAPLQIDAE